MQSLTAYFDGKVIVPEEPVQLPVGQRLRLHLELAEPDSPRFAGFLRLEADLPDAPADLAAQHEVAIHGHSLNLSHGAHHHLDQRRLVGFAGGGGSHPYPSLLFPSVQLRRGAYNLSA